MNIVSVNNITLGFGEAAILEDVSFHIAAGDYIGIVGPNGGGKTTLLRAILGLLPIRSGSIHLFGSPPARFKEWKRIAFLPQAANLPGQRFPASVREVVAAGRIPHMGLPRRLTPTDQDAIHRAITELHLEELADRMISTLSGGQYQRVCLARAIAAEPDLLLLDEPASALDPAFRPLFYSLLARLNRERKTAILLVTHDGPTIAEQASRLLYLDRRVVFDGTFHDFCRSPGMGEYFGPTQHLMCGQHAHPHDHTHIHTEDCP